MLPSDFPLKNVFCKPLPVSEKNYRGYLEVGILWSQQGSTRLFGLDSFKKLGDLSKAFELRGRKMATLCCLFIERSCQLFGSNRHIFKFCFLVEWLADGFVGLNTKFQIILNGELRFYQTFFRRLERVKKRQQKKLIF